MIGEELGATVRDPILRERTLHTFAHGFDMRRPLEPGFERAIAGWYEAYEDRLALDPAFLELGFRFLDRSSSDDVRRWGAVILTGFPTVDVVTRVAAMLDDDSTPDTLRAQAAWTLGYRRLARRPDTVVWTKDAIATADAALTRAFRSGLHRLPLVCRALRHSDSVELAEAMATDPGAASQCVLAFATPELARVLLASVASLPPERAPIVVRLAAAVLGDESLDALLALADHPSIAMRLEALFAAVTIDEARAGSELDALVGTFRFPGDLIKRRELHRAHAGRHTIIEALRVAMTTACIEPSEREVLCAGAARDLLDARDARAAIGDDELTSLSIEVAYRARTREPALLVRAIGEGTSALDDDGELADAYLDALGRTGRYRTLTEQASRLGRSSDAAYVLATHARPFLALAARLASRIDDERGADAEALALLLLGRPDLIERDATPLLARLEPPPPGADADQPDFSLVSKFSNRSATLDGVAVWVARDVPDRDALVGRLRAAGARTVDAPFVGTHYYVLGESSDALIRARLDRVRARPLPSRWAN